MPASLINKIEKNQDNYLKDESRRVGKATTISFPREVKEVKMILQEMSRGKIPVTIQGALTGIAGGGSPSGGHILNLSKMNNITGLCYQKGNNSYFLKVQPGVLLSQLRDSLQKMDFITSDWSTSSVNALQEMKEDVPRFFAPDPTETSASIGGMVACDASGARSFYYGSTRNYIEGLQVILVDGSEVNLKRGQQQLEGRNFKLQTDSGKKLEGKLPGYKMPAVKNTAGYYVKDNMDLIDLFIGAEGTLGVITEIELRLIPAPATTWGIISFFTSEADAIAFVRKIRGEMEKGREERKEKREQKKQMRQNQQKQQEIIPPLPVAIEFFNHNALNLLKKVQQEGSSTSDIPQIPDDYHTAVYIEYQGDDEEQLYHKILKAAQVLTDSGGNNNATWVGTDSQEMARLKEFRHAVPEAVNQLIDKRRKQEPGLTKLGTDMAVPDASLIEVMEMYNSSLKEAGLDSVIFGHIGDNHLHVNIIPETMAEYNQGKQLYTEWAREIVKMGGSVSAEHGIGKLKVSFLQEMFSDREIREMQQLKQIFDPDFLLNQGNLFQGRCSS